MIEAHHPQNPKDQVDSVNKSIRLQHTLYKNSVIVFARMHPKGSYDCQNFVDSSEGKSDEEGNYDDFLHGGCNSIEESETVTGPSEDISYERDEPYDFKKGSVFGVVTVDEEEVGPDCASRGVGDPLHPVKRQKQDHYRQDHVERYVSDVVDIEHSLGWTLFGLVIVASRIDDDNDALQQVDNIEEQKPIPVIPRSKGSEEHTGQAEHGHSDTHYPDYLERLLNTLHTKEDSHQKSCTQAQTQLEETKQNVECTTLCVIYIALHCQLSNLITPHQSTDHINLQKTNLNQGNPIKQGLVQKLSASLCTIQLLASWQERREPVQG